ncbi:DUF7322 domain-containing protein [Haloarchaeobius sp. DFWS5]|uniref:DUF7322 domain-containing protein n=1 Tax=Haloarchaeobius sp. DFWS5 TaxID=3446114 RepID=UPI003EBD6185
MFNERSEHEPDEHDAESDLRDWESELTPSVRIPEAPQPRNFEEVDAPGELQFQFWRLVIAFNGALLGLSLGTMFVVFDGNWSLGSKLLLGGLICAAYGGYRLHTFDRSELVEDDSDDEDDDDDAEAESESGDATERTATDTTDTE